MRTSVHPSVLLLVCSAASVAMPSGFVTSGYGFVDVQSAGANTWTITIVSTDPPAGQSPADTAVTINTVAGQSISLITMRNRSGETPGLPQRSLRVNVLRPASATPPMNIGAVAIDSQTSNRNINLLQLNATGTLGSVAVPQIGEIRVDGDITGDITALPWPGGASNIGLVFSMQTIRGDITAEFGSIGEVRAAGDIARFSATFPFVPVGPVSIRARDSIGVVRSDNQSVRADIDANAFNATGTLGPCWRRWGRSRARSGGAGSLALTGVRLRRTVSAWGRTSAGT